MKTKTKKLDEMRQRTEELRRFGSRKLNAKELAVLRQCVAGPATLAAMAARFRRSETSVQANSWARNSVRRPVRLGLMKKSARGTYAITPLGKYVLDWGMPPSGLSVAKAHLDG